MQTARDIPRGFFCPHYPHLSRSAFPIFLFDSPNDLDHPSMQDLAVPTVADIVSALQLGRTAEAEQMTRTWLERAPGSEDALLLLTMSLQLQGRTHEAVETCRELIRLNPRSSTHWSNLGTALRDAGELNEAEEAYRQAVQFDPKFFGGWMNLGYLQMEFGKYIGAHDCFLAAHALDPASAEARIYAAQMCVALDLRMLAKQLIEPRKTWFDLSDELILELAGTLSSLGATEEGIALFESLLRKDANNLRATAQLVVLYERINRLDEARTLLAKLPNAETIDDAKLRYDVIGAQATFALRETDYAHTRNLLERLIAAFADSPDAQFKPWRADDLYFSLATVLDKQGDVDASMTALVEAHRRQMLLAQQAVPDLVKPGTAPLILSTKRISAEMYASWPQDPGPSMMESPIFVVGFPRSGTTMLEQMLDAHPSLQSMDERAFLQDLIHHMERLGYAHPYDLGKLSSAQCEEMRQLYWSATAQVVPLREGQRLVDKNPLHMLLLPLINRLFPNAQIILALRHPCDVLLSNYMQNFTAKPFTVLCSNLERLAQGYVNAMESWLHHVDLLKPRLTHSRYEDLLDDFSGNVKRIGDFLHLEDASPLGRFDQHARDKGFISTPSYTRVIEPPNKKAVNRWRRYQRYFEPVLPILQPMIEHWGYDV